MNTRPMRRRLRGSSLLEVMATMAIMSFGIVSLATAVGKTASSTRKNLRLTHGQMVAERVLEELSLLGCATAPALNADPCWDIKLKDNISRHFWVTAEGLMQESPTLANPYGRFDMQYYHVATDVDPPFEGTATGSPAVTRPLALGLPGKLVNVRVTVSWLDPSDKNQMQTAILQTRVSPGREAQ